MRRRPTTTLATATALALLGAGGSAAAAPPPEHDDDTVIVKYRPGVAPAERGPLLERVGGERTIEGVPGVGAKVVEVEEDPERVARRLDRSRKVAYAEPNVIMTAQGRRPDDARFSSLWGLRNVGQTGGSPGADIGAVKGWRRANLRGFPRGGGVPVGIVDTGIDLLHPDLEGKTVACTERVPPFLATGSCADDTGHGTHIAGTVGAIANNGIGISGVAFNSPLIVCRALGGEFEEGRVSDIAKCIRWTHRQGARVISMSFAGGPSKTLRRAVKRVWKRGGKRGAVLVGAAGNNAGHQRSYPAAYPQVMSIAATNDRDRRAWFSNRHQTVELAAPGVGILSARPGGSYRRLSGTSMAVPHVSGVAAQVRRLNPKRPARKVRRVLRRSARDLGPAGRDTRFGFGRVTLAGAVRR